MKTKRLRLGWAALPALMLMAFVAGDRLPIGAKAPLADLEMTDVSGRTVTLAEAAGENGLLVLFTSNTCPWVKAWEDRYLATAATAQALGVGMIAVNSNEAHRARGEGLGDMKKRAREKGYTFYYALDRDHRLADAFGAERAPEVFLFDKNLTLVYTGAIDDNPRHPDAVTHPYLLDAMRAMVEGRPVPVASTKAIGCAIKRVRG
ncbi:thioredoxin family protein [Rhodocaloribacter sp.]